MDLLYAYAYSKLLYNGNWGRQIKEVVDVAECVLTLSVVLSDPAAAAVTLESVRDSVWQCDLTLIEWFD